MSKFSPRTVFPRYTIPMANFQGHHRVGLQRMYALAPQVDMVVELRDARAPLSTRNGLFDRILGQKRKIILYTKNDLSSINSDVFKTWHPETQYNQIDCRKDKDAKRVLDMAKDVYNSMTPKPPLGIRLLITGMPNVGKSTFLNTLRKVGMDTKHKVAATGGQPGVTRDVSNVIRVSRDPDIFIHDTPGVFVPRTKNIETMLALCLTGAVKPTFVDPVIVADFLLYRLNLEYPDGRAYKQFCEPTNDIGTLLYNIAKKINKMGKKGGDYDDVGTALWLVDRWRQGKEFKLMLDDSSEGAYKQSTKELADSLRHFEMDFQKESRRFKRGIVF